MDDVEAYLVISEDDTQAQGRLILGGGIFMPRGESSVAVYGDLPNGRMNDLGFRVARTAVGYIRRSITLAARRVGPTPDAVSQLIHHFVRTRS